MKKAKAFLIYKDAKDIVDELSDDQAGVLFKSIFNYEVEGNIPKFKDKTTNIVFKMFKIHLDRAREEYSSICKKRSQAGKKGGLASASKSKQKVANATNININNKKKGWVGINE
jgi:hypothetical protein